MKSSSSRPAGNSRFWTISLLFHLAAVLVLFLTPAGQRFLSQGERPVRPEIVRQDKELADVMDQIRALAIGRLKGAIGEIEAAGVVMEDKLITTASEYESYADAQTASVSERLTGQSERLVRSQRTLLEAVSEFARTRDAGTLKAAYEERRAAITEGQAQMRRAAQLAGTAGQDLVTRQETLEDEQFTVFEHLTTAFEKQAEHEKLKKRLTEFSAEEKALRTTVSRATPRQEILSPEVEAAKQKRVDLFQATRKAETRTRNRKLDLAKAENRGQGVEAARTALEAARTDSEASRAELTAADESLKKLSDELSDIRNELAGAAKRLPVLETEIPKLKKRVPETARESEAGLTAALAGQKQVCEIQAQLCLELRALVLVSPANGSEENP